MDFPTPRADLFSTLSDPALDPLFYRPSRLSAESAWHGHLPFAAWITEALRPATLVELGTQAGLSYAAFCDAVLRARLPTRCFAVDRWTGDEHAGYYGNEVFEEFERYHERRYGGFSRLLRMSFDEALPAFPDGGIDLLHIDGRHYYEDVRHDYKIWAPKLSPRAVVLFHDTNVREGGFGVWRFWAEIAGQFPSFEFYHAHGLGVLVHGTEAPPAILALCHASDPERVRERFAFIGERWQQDGLRRALGRALRDVERDREAAAKRIEHLAWLERKLTADYDDVEARRQTLADTLEHERAESAKLAAKLQYDVENLRRDLGHREDELTFLRERLAYEESTRTALEAEAAQLPALREDRARLEEQLRASLAEFAVLEGRAAHEEARRAHADAQVLRLELERDMIFRSRSWRAAMLLARTARRVPGPWRRAAMRLRHGDIAPARRGVVETVLPPEPDHSPHAAPETPAPSATAPGAASPPPPLSDGVLAPPPPASAVPAPERPVLVGKPKPVRPQRRTETRRVVFVSGEPGTPGHEYRIRRAAHAIASLGWKADMADVNAATAEVLTGADVVIIWRAIWNAEIDRILSVCRAAGIVTVFDVDDLMFRPELARIKLIDGIRTQDLSELEVQRYYVRVSQTAAAVDLASASTVELAEHLHLLKKPTFVVPNCWDEASRRHARRAVRARAAASGTGALVRIGYASGTRTHQKDFAAAVPALVRVLRARENVRLVLFRDPDGGDPIVMPDEYPALQALSEKIEWRDKVPLADLPDEIARFDINLAPLETGNPFVEAKSELKFWEAALAGVPTVASPTGPLRRAVNHGVTGFLAGNDSAWEEHLLTLIDDRALRAEIAHRASLDVLWRFGPLRQREAIASMLDQARGGRTAARAMQLDLLAASAPRRTPTLPVFRTVFAHDALGDAEVTVVIPLYNYAQYVGEALDSVAAQTEQILDLIVIDDGSADRSLSVAESWARAHAERFNRLLVLAHRENSGLALTRNTGFSNAETPYVLPLDADNRLLPECCAELAARLRASGAAYVYPTVRRFGKDALLIGDEPYVPARFVSSNYVDAMALVCRDAWAAVGGYDHIRFGWEDYDFWCKMVELGLWGEHVQSILAEYRAHEASMLNTSTDVRDNKIALINDMKARHPWLDMTAMMM